MESFEHSQDFHAHNHSAILNPAHGVQRSGDGRGDWLIACPLPNSSVEQWYNNFFLSDPTNNKHQRRFIVSTVSETQQKQTKSILPAQLTEQENFTPIAERATDN